MCKEKIELKRPIGNITIAIKDLTYLPQKREEINQ